MNHHHQQQPHPNKARRRDDPPSEEEETPPAATVLCETCGKEIAAMSALVHQAHCQQHNHRKQQQQQQQRVPPLQPFSPDTRYSTTRTSSQPTPPPQPIQHVEESPPPRNDFPLRQQQDQWSCPRCTLLNPQVELQCEVCGYTRHPTATTSTLTHRPTATTNHHHHRTTAVPTNELSNFPQHGTSPTPAQANVVAETTNGYNDDTMMGTPSGNIHLQVYEVNPAVAQAAAGTVSVLSWTLLGGLVGGPLGAMVGGTTAALVAGTRAWQAQSQQPQPQPQQGDASTNTTQEPSSQGGAGRNRRNYNNNNNNNFITFTSTRVHRNSDGSMVHTITTNGNAEGRMRTVVMQVPPGMQGNIMTLADERILQMLLQHAYHNRPGGGTMNVDQMSYDELLERFGVGTEHRRGASPETIQSIPLVKLEDEGALQALPDHQRTCNICLEDFVVGDNVRKLVDCTHVFHAACLDRWLQRVASCPICKTEVHGRSDNETTSATTSS